MAITNGQNADASDFVSTPSGAGDSGKVPKLDATGKIPLGFLRFGGTGADGALSITSGTTTLSAAAANLLIKNYTSISITGTGKLAFSNPHTNGTRVILKSQGAVTLTSSTVPLIDMGSMGAAVGSAAFNGTWFVNSAPTAGGGFLASGSVAAAPGGSLSLAPTSPALDLVGMKYPFMHMASSGQNGGAFNANGGGTSSATAGVAGVAPGSLVIECGGALNFTGTINANGTNGTSGTATGSGGGSAAAGGGSGAGGGFVGIFYNTLTANSGTINTNAGTGAAGVVSGSGNANAQGAGSGAGKVPGSAAAAITSVGGNSASAGETGGAGYSLVAANTEFA